MFCGSRRSLKSIDDVEEDEWIPKPQPPKVSKKKMKKKADKNPFSTLGLDKFSAMLADLEARKARIMAEAAAQGASSTTTAVYFMYSESNECVPILVRLEDEKLDARKQYSNDLKPQLVPPATEVDVEEVTPLDGCKDAKEVVIKETNTASEKRSLPAVKGWWWEHWRPGCYWPLPAVVLILLCLLMFGRVFAICFTSAWWYLVPMMPGEGKNERRHSKKKKKAKKVVDGVKVRSPRGHACAN